MDPVDRIRRKLRTVPSLRERRLVFGEAGHRWEVRPPLTEDAVAAAESALGVRLALSYRTYLLAIADGRAGPGYGIYPLLGVDDPVGDLDVPCPLDLDQVYDGRGWALRFEDGPDPYDGMLPIGHRGCAYVTAILVTGVARGRVVHIDLERSPPVFYQEPTFLDWYESWLDGVAASVVDDETLLRTATGGWRRTCPTSTASRRTSSSGCARIGCRRCATGSTS